MSKCVGSSLEKEFKKFFGGSKYFLKISGKIRSLKKSDWGLGNGNQATFCQVCCLHKELETGLA